jgi:hypothetical protein
VELSEEPSPVVSQECHQESLHLGGVYVFGATALPRTATQYGIRDSINVVRSHTRDGPRSELVPASTSFRYSAAFA